MIIPGEASQRLAFYLDVAERCAVSRDKRKADYETWRSWYLFGSPPQEPPCYFNKIYPALDQLLSFINSSETTRFSIDIGEEEDEGYHAKTPAMQKLLNAIWHDTDTDMIFDSALRWALVYALVPIKIVRSGYEPKAYIVHPADYGVLREDVLPSERQEAVVQHYLISRSELYRRIYRHPHREDIVSRIATGGEKRSDMPPAVERIVLSQTSPNVVGTVNIDLYGWNRMEANIDQDTVEMRELYIWNDEENDYQVVTLADPDIVIYDRPQASGENGTDMFLKGMLPFIHVCPNPLPDYFWGNSDVQRLIPLQQLRNTRMQEILVLLQKQVDPPKFLSGYQGILDEKTFTLNRPGSYMSSDMPGAKVDQLAPDMPEDLWRELKEIDTMFEESIGISPIMTGHGETGVRSAGHASQLARLGAARTKKRALVVEDVLEKVASTDLSMLQKYWKKPLVDTEGKEFIPEQFTKDFMVKVDAHSNSPIFMEDSRSLAFNLFKVGAIDREMLVRMLQPPMEQMILDKLKKMPPPQPQPQKGKKGGGGAGEIEMPSGGE